MGWDKICDDMHREFVESSSIKITANWEQVRIQAAIAAMQGMVSGTLVEDYETTAENAVGYADALVEELKKEK